MLSASTTSLSDMVEVSTGLTARLSRMSAPVKECQSE
jgi:hypothetical protein